MLVGCLMVFGREPFYIKGPPLRVSQLACDRSVKHWHRNCDATCCRWRRMSQPQTRLQQSFCPEGVRGDWPPFQTLPKWFLILGQMWAKVTRFCFLMWSSGRNSIPSQAVLVRAAKNSQTSCATSLSSKKVTHTDRAAIISHTTPTS